VITDKDGNYTFEFKALSDYRDDKIQANIITKLPLMPQISMVKRIQLLLPLE
jgi:hypothetical protein